MGTTDHCPVLTANPAAFWYGLRHAGVHAPVNGYRQEIG